MVLQVCHLKIVKSTEFNFLSKLGVGFTFLVFDSDFFGCLDVNFFVPPLL